MATREKEGIASMLVTWRVSSKVEEWPSQATWASLSSENFSISTHKHFKYQYYRRRRCLENRLRQPWLTNLCLMTRTKLASVGFVAPRNCMRQQVPHDAKSLPVRGRSQSATTRNSSDAPKSAEYYSLLVTTEYYEVLLRTTAYYSVLQSTTPVRQSTTPVLLCITKYYSSTTLTAKYYASTTPYYKVLLQYFSVLESTTPVLLFSTTYYKVLLQYCSVLESSTPVLLCTTKYYSSTTLYYQVLRQYHSVLQSTTPVLLCTTRYYASTNPCYKVLYSSTTLYYKVLRHYHSLLQSTIFQYYSVLQSTSSTAQGGSGSFKNRKIGCCESWMTK